jgi:20S proteasome alpha/beta subunit
MGSDSACIEGDSISVGQTKTWFIDDTTLAGFSGNFAEGDFMQYAFHWPQKKKDQTFHSWLVRNVQPLLQKRMKERFEDRKDIPIEWSLMIATKSPAQIYILSQCGHVEKVFLHYAAIGSAQQTANGCLETLELQNNMVSWEKVDYALRVASKFHASVRSPYHFKVLV